MFKLFGILVVLFLLTAGVPYQSSFPSTIGQHRILGYIAAADFTSTIDQQIPIDPRVTKYVVTAIYFTGCSGNISATGAIWTGPGRTGLAIITNQAYTATMSVSSFVSAPLTTVVTQNTSSLTKVYFNLSVGNSVPRTCDIFIDGIDLTPF